MATRNIAVAIVTDAARTVSGITVTLVDAGICYAYRNQAVNLYYPALEHRMRYSSPNQ